LGERFVLDARGGERRSIAGNVNQRTALSDRYIPRGHALSGWMLAVTPGAILITSIDRVLLPTVLPGWHYSETSTGQEESAAPQGA
jgi:hypothetical protein